LDLSSAAAAAPVMKRNENFDVFFMARNNYFSFLDKSSGKSVVI